MGTTIQETANLKYTDSSGKFYEGMTREEAHDGRFDGGIFTEGKMVQEFNRIDKDLDGVLSHDEVSDELREVIGSSWTSGVTDLGLSALWGVLSNRAKKAGRSKLFAIYLGFGFFDMALSIYHLIKIRKLKTRVAQGHN